MRCLRCGHCCINYDVMILDDPSKGLVPDNIKHKPSGEKCQHLLGDKPGGYSCAIHDHQAYRQTPCFDFGQIGYGNTDCRVGVYILKKEKSYET